MSPSAHNRAEDNLDFEADESLALEDSASPADLSANDESLLVAQHEGTYMNDQYSDVQADNHNTDGEAQSWFEIGSLQNATQEHSPIHQWNQTFGGPSQELDYSHGIAGHNGFESCAPPEPAQPPIPPPGGQSNRPWLVSHDGVDNTWFDRAANSQNLGDALFKTGQAVEEAVYQPVLIEKGTKRALSRRKGSNIFVKVFNTAKAKQLKRQRAIIDGSVLHCQFCNSEINADRVDNMTRHHRDSCRMIQSRNPGLRQRLVTEHQKRKESRAAKKMSKSSDFKVKSESEFEVVDLDSINQIDQHANDSAQAGPSQPRPTHQTGHHFDQSLYLDTFMHRPVPDAWTLPSWQIPGHQAHAHAQPSSNEPWWSNQDAFFDQIMDSRSVDALVDHDTPASEDEQEGGLSKKARGKRRQTKK